MSGTHQSPSALATIERLYPPEEITCHLCDKRLTSRISMGDHYEQVHSCHFVWRCSHCLAKTYTKSTSMSSHYTRCRKNPSLSPASTAATNTDSHSAAGSELPQGPTPSSAIHNEGKEHRQNSRDSERADRSMPFTTSTPVLRLPPAGDWTTADFRTLAVQELSMPVKMKFVNKELAKGYAGIPWQTIKGIRARKLYRDLLQQEQLRRRLPRPDTRVPAQSKPPTVTPGGPLASAQESSSPQAGIPSTPITAPRPQWQSGRSIHHSPTPFTPPDIPPSPEARPWTERDTQALVLCELQAPLCMRSDEELAAVMPRRTWQSVRDQRQTPQYAEAMRRELCA
ncbi:unnamed protein product [Ixodes pacificus]